MLGENKGINLPGIAVNVPLLTEKDEEDLVFAIGRSVDTVAVSFVRSAADVRHVKTRLAALNSDAWVIAKLEKPQAIEHLDSILEVADATSWSPAVRSQRRGPTRKSPRHSRKHIIRRAAEYRRPVITATQMLESMIENFPAPPAPKPPTSPTPSTTAPTPSCSQARPPPASTPSRPSP